LSPSDNIPLIIVRNTLFLLLKYNISISRNLLSFRIINPIDITIITLVTYKVANLYSSIYFLALNALFFRDINIYLYILYLEEGERDIIRTS
jgi:hypothetical protein